MQLNDKAGRARIRKMLKRIKADDLRKILLAVLGNAFTDEEIRNQMWIHEGEDHSWDRFDWMAEHLAGLVVQAGVTLKEEK
jgi:hypothetical protein